MTWPLPWRGRMALVRAARGGKENLRRRGMRIFFEEMVLDFPGIIEAKPVGQFHLFKRLVKKIALVALVPRPRQLQLVENAKAHIHPSLRNAFLYGKTVVRRRIRCRGWRRAWQGHEEAKLQGIDPRPVK